MASITELVESEVQPFPDNVGHVLGSRSLRGHQLPERPPDLLGLEGTRRPINDSAAMCKKMLGAA